jgi:hypothetical protein
MRTTTAIPVRRVDSDVGARLRPRTGSGREVLEAWGEGARASWAIAPANLAVVSLAPWAGSCLISTARPPTYNASSLPLRSCASPAAWLVNGTASTFSPSTEPA